jgi:hypothetical protein
MSGCILSGKDSYNYYSISFFQFFKINIYICSVSRESCERSQTIMDEIVKFKQAEEK